MVSLFKNDITSMMIMRDNRMLNIMQNDSDADEFQIAHTLKHLPGNFQQVLISDVDKLAAFLPTFFEKTTHPKGYEFCYAYKVQQAERETLLTILTHQPPVTPDDFFALALAINNQSLYYDRNVIVCDEAGERVGEQAQIIFIYSILQDAALAGHAGAAKALANLKQDAQANHYLCISRFASLYSYKDTGNFIFLETPLTLPEEFFDLANRLAQNGKVYVYNANQIVIADAMQLQDFIYALLSDASKAGLPCARAQLINATIAGNRAARQFVTFARFNPDLPILLPCKFVSADQFRMLSTSLIMHGKICLDNTRPLEGPFYIVPQGNNAVALGYQIRALAKQLSDEEDTARKALIDSMNKATNEEVKPEAKPNCVMDTSHWTHHYHTFFSGDAVTKTLLPTLELDDNQHYFELAKP
jgi:hypothetical protein